MVQAVNALRRARSTYLYVMQVMFFLLSFVCWLVCPSAELLKKIRTVFLNIYETIWKY